MTGPLAEGVVQGGFARRRTSPPSTPRWIESIADPTLMVGLAIGTIGVRVDGRIRKC